MARTVAAMVAGRKRYIARRHAMGLKAPGGRMPNVGTMQATIRQALIAVDTLIRDIEELMRDPEAMARLDERLRALMAT